MGELERIRIHICLYFFLCLGLDSSRQELDEFESL